MQTLVPTLTTVPARALLAVDGRGAPEDAPFTATIRALFAVRAALGAVDEVPLEGTYAQDGDALRCDLDAPHGWHWTLAVPAPEGRTAEAVATAGARFGAPVELRPHPARGEPHDPACTGPGGPLLPRRPGAHGHHDRPAPRPRRVAAGGA